MYQHSSLPESTRMEILSMIPDRVPPLGTAESVVKDGRLTWVGWLLLVCFLEMRKVRYVSFMWLKLASTSITNKQQVHLSLIGKHYAFTVQA